MVLWIGILKVGRDQVYKYKTELLDSPSLEISQARLDGVLWDSGRCPCDTKPRVVREATQHCWSRLHCGIILSNSL